MYNIFSKYAKKSDKGEFIIGCQLDYATREIVFTYDKYQKAVKATKKDFEILKENEEDFIDFCLNSI